jgi:hypothetical protein
MKGVRNGVSIFLSTGYCIGTVLAVLLNLILPADSGVDMGDGRVVGADSELNKTYHKKITDHSGDNDDEDNNPKKEAVVVPYEVTKITNRKADYDDEVSA